MIKHSKINMVIQGILIVALLVLLDQWTKWLAVTRLKENRPYVLIKGVFELTYLENTGAAFGILENSTTLFIISTAVLLVLLTWFYMKIPSGKKYLYLRLLCILVYAGAIGNFIDRIRSGYVVDFFYFSLINFPVFNIADCYVVVAGILMFILVLFYYKEEDLAFLPFFSSKSKKKEGKEEDGK